MRGFLAAFDVDRNDLDWGLDSISVVRVVVVAGKGVPPSVDPSGGSATSFPSPNNAMVGRERGVADDKARMFLLFMDEELHSIGDSGFRRRF